MAVVIWTLPVPQPHYQSWFTRVFCTHGNCIDHSSFLSLFMDIRIPKNRQVRNSFRFGPLYVHCCRSWVHPSSGESIVAGGFLTPPMGRGSSLWELRLASSVCVQVSVCTWLFTKCVGNSWKVQLMEVYCDLSCDVLKSFVRAKVWKRCCFIWWELIDMWTGF